MADKKNIMTYAGLKKLQDELQDFLRMLSTMQQKMSRETSRHVLSRSSRF